MHCHAQLLLHELGGSGKHFAGWVNSILIFCVANIQSVLYSVEKCTCSRHQALIISSYTLVPINHPKSLVKTPGQTVLLSHGGLTFSQPSMTPHFPWKPSSSLDILTFFLRHLWSFPTMSLMRPETVFAMSEEYVVNIRDCLMAQSGPVVHARNPSTWELEAWGSGVEFLLL